MSTFKTYLLSLIIFLISTSAFAQGNSGPSPTGGAHPGVGTCPAGQVVNRLGANVGPPYGCVSTSSLPISLNPYTGPVGITGNQGNGSDFVTNVNANGVENVKAFGASGNDTPITCTSDGSTAVLTACSSLVGWAAGTNMYALLVNAGTANALSTPAAPTVTPATTGTGCTGAVTHTYAYEVAACKSNSDGISCTPASSSSTPTSAEAICPGSSNFTKNTLSAYTVATATYYKPYRSVDGGPFNKMTETSSSTYVDVGQPGIDQNTIAVDDSYTAPASAIASSLDANIVSINSTTSMTISVIPTTAGTLTIYHNDSFAFRAAKTAATAANGGEIFVPSSNRCYPVVVDGASISGAHPLNVMEFLAADSNESLIGTTPEASCIRVISQGKSNFSAVNAIVSIVGAGSTAGSVAPSVPTTALSATLLAGSMSAPVASVSGFAAGDYILIRTGQNDAGTTTNPSAELNQVASLDTTNNVIYFRWPIGRTYQQEYFISAALTGITSVAPLWSVGVYAANNLVTCNTNCPGAVPTIFSAAVALGGNTGASEPNWNGSCPSATNTCSDGNVTWTNVGPVATQAAIFGIADMAGFIAHDVQVRNLSFRGPQGGVQSASGVRFMQISQTDRVVFDNLNIAAADIGSVGWDHDTTLTNSTVLWERMSGAGSAFGGANGVSQFIIDKNVFHSPQAMSWQVNEGTMGFKVTNNEFDIGFPAFPTQLATIQGSGGYDFLIANNYSCGTPGVGFVSLANTSGHANQFVNIVGNVIKCPYPSTIPDSFTRNRGGSISVQDPGSTVIENNSFYPKASWDDFTFAGTPGYGNSNTGFSRGNKSCTAKINFSQAAATTGVPLCTVPTNSQITSCTWKPTTTFNAATTNVISIGGSTAATTYVSNTTFSGTTQVSLPLNAAAGLITTTPFNAANNLTAYYSFTGTAPTTGIGSINCQYITEGQ